MKIKLNLLHRPAKNLWQSVPSREEHASARPNGKLSSVMSYNIEAKIWPYINKTKGSAKFSMIRIAPCGI